MEHEGKEDSICSWCGRVCKGTGGTGHQRKNRNRPDDRIVRISLNH